MQYDVSAKIIHPTITEYNTNTIKCVMCGREVTAGNAVKQTRETSWFDWDDPDEDAQGQRKYRNNTEWYCCGFDEGFGTLECFRAVIAQGIDAKTESLIRIATDDVRADVKSAAAALLKEKAQFNREAAYLLAQVDEAALYDDNSPGKIGV